MAAVFQQVHWELCVMGSTTVGTDQMRDTVVSFQPYIHLVQLLVCVMHCRSFFFCFCFTSFENYIYQSCDVILSISAHRNTTVPNNHQSTQLPHWSVLLPTTRGLHWKRTTLWWCPSLSQRRGWSWLPSPQHDYSVWQVKSVEKIEVIVHKLFCQVLSLFIHYLISFLVTLDFFVIFFR